MKEYETIADLTSSKQSSTGLLLWCRENLLYYIVQADGYTATGDDITFSNGRVGKAIDIADASQIKTITGNVQDDLSSIISGGLPSQVGQAGEYLRTDGTNAYWDSVVGLGAIGKTPEEYGAVGDGVTDDTAALQAAIDAIKGSGALGLPTNYLVLEAKTYAHTGLVIDRAINIIGKDRNASRLKCLTTSAAAISVSLEYDTTNYQTAGRPGPTVAIKDCIIESDKGFAATNYGIRAFDATTNHIRGWIYLDGVDIHSMGGDALFANTWEGAIKAANCKFINNAGKQINATSCADWQFVGCEFGVTPDDNILLSGCAAFTFTTCNIYSSTGDLVTLFTDAAATAPVNHQFVSCSFDRSSMGHGVIYNVRNDGNVTFTNCYWTYNGQGAPETYSDIWIDASVGRGPTIVGGWMQDPSISDSLYNIFFNGASSSCYTTGVQFEGGNARSTNVTNSLPQLKFEGAENFDTFTDLEASTWPEIGDEVKVVSGANAPFIIKDAGSYTALAGDRTLANGRVGALQKSPNMPVTMFGMVGDGATDNKDEWKAACDYLNESHGSVVIPSGVFAVTRGAALFHGTVTHEDGGIIRNTANIDNSSFFWDNTALFAGTYFGYDSAYGVNAETQYLINDASIGDDRVTLKTAGDSANFAVGDIVFIRSTETYGATDFSTGSHVTRVKAVSSGVIELRDKICIDIVNDGVSDCFIMKQTGGITLPATYTGRTTDPAKCADGLNIINGQYESLALDNSQVVHVSAIDSNLHFKKVSGQSCFGVNPFAHSEVNCKEGNFTLRGLEIAYLHQNIYSDLLVFNRVGDPANDNSDSIPLSFSEYGNGKYLGKIVINDSIATQNTNFSSCAFTTPLNHVGKLVLNGSNGAAAVGFSAGRAYSSTCDYLEVISSAGDGIVIDSYDVIISKAIVRGMTDASSRAVRFKSGSSGSEVGRLITPATDSRYTVLDESTSKGNKVLSAKVFTSQEEVNELGFAGISGTGVETVERSYSIPAGTSTKNSSWKVRVIGNIPGSSTTGAKEFKLRVGAAVVPISIGAPATGFFELNLELVKKLDNLSQLVRGSSNFNNGSVTSFNGTLAINTETTDIDIEFVANLNAADSFNLREWSVTADRDVIDF